jgi:DNA polymerase-3 subunit alpha
MNEREQLLRLCIKGLETKQLLSGTYKDRLKLELKEIDQQGDHEYFLKLVEKKSKFAQNENNLLIPFLLDLVDNVDLDTPPAYAQGEYPDIDTDYLPEIRDYLKNDWAPKKFGREFVCSISTYGTLGIKSVMLDVAKVHDLPRDEVLIITKQIQDKDDDGNLIEWDKAQQMYPAFKEYCTNHPEVAEAAQVLIDRRKSAGVHAGGLIISSKPLSDFVPLEVRSVNKDNKYGVIVAAWTEGQATQDLQPVGLVKFDLLVVDGLKQIALSTQLIKDRHNLQNLYALPGKRNWSDTSYLRDTDALNMASKGDLVCIFQFGSEGIRKLAKQGGIDSFQDLVALNALYRPGPMGAGMHETFVKRKTGKERYTLHPLLEPILSKTYGVMCFQEDVMKILNVVGNIPLIHCEKVRKAISKKKIEQFAKYKDMFVINGQKNLNYSQDQVESLWSQIESFADYGFNLSVTENTLIPTPTGLKQIQDFVRGDKVFSINELGQKEVDRITIASRTCFLPAAEQS